ncbi:unnamed protein product [Allacma fusca]|uniref:Ion transport domain-containing protein n=1 Tax=Allacma fusca TaxID=39272 RepID=A0A8J2PAG0_9HEXA|nr:unnamed protein product [Allacma fusca]
MPEANSHDHLDESESHNAPNPTSSPNSQGIINDENENPGTQLGKASRAEFNDSKDTDTDTDIDEIQEPAVLLEMVKLEPDELELFDAVACGDINTVNKLIEDMSFENIQRLSTKYNEERDTLFHVTVRRQDEAMLEFLFFHVPNVDNILYDILMLAISESNVSIVHNILNEIDSNVKLKLERGLLSELPRWDNSQFPVHMTPMMLSGITGNYELITIFGSRGEVIEPSLKNQQRPPTSVARQRRNCCGECFCCCMSEPPESGLFDHLAADYQRLNEYQAKASPEMLCYYANNSSHFDPILKSLEYINELNVIKMVEIEFRDEYEQIITKLKDFAVQLISKCENPLELDLLLSRREGYHGAHDKYPRVIMAIEMGFKEFVAHPHTQGTLYMEWAGDDWYEWRFLTVPEKFRQFIYRTLFLPLYLLFVCGEQGNNHGRLLASPLSRCIYSCISQVFFIGLSMAEQTLELRQPRFRQPPNKYLEITLVIFVAGQIRLLVKQFFTAPKIFFKQAWNWYDCINYGLYCCCFACWGVLYLRDGHESDFFDKYQPAERLNWSYMDVFMVADCFLALGTVMASGKLLRYVQLNSTIGPIQVALGKMIKNISLFIPMFTIVFSSFALAITAIYAPYVTVAQENESQHALGTHMNTLYQMYWGLYGMTDTSSADMGTWLSKNGTQTDPYHYITAELAGKLLFSVYTLLGATILFSSMLVAYMVNTFGAIIEENEMNWKFSRAELWIYFSRSSVMPPPLNLLPTIWDIIHFFKTIREVGKDPHRYFLTCNCAVCLHSATRFTDKERQQQEELYHDFVKTLIRRYFRYQADLESRALASAEETTTLSEDMEELQSMINNVLLRLGHPGGDGHHDGAGGGGGGHSGQIHQNYSFTNRTTQSSSSVLDAKHPGSGSRTGRLQRHSSTGVPGSGTVRDTTSSSKHLAENKSPKAPPSTRTTPSKEDNSKTLEGKPSVVQSAVLKYTQKLSSDLVTPQTSPTKSVRSTAKTGDDKSSGQSSTNLDNNIPKPPAIPPNPPSYPDTKEVKKVFPKPIISSEKSIGNKSLTFKEQGSQKPSHTSMPIERKNFDKHRKDANQKRDEARSAKQIPEGRQSADKPQNYSVNENSEVMTKTTTWKTGTSNLEKPQLSTSSIPRKPPLPPLPSSPSSSADPATSRSVKKKLPK